MASVQLSDLDGFSRSNHGLVTPAGTGLSRSAWYRAIKAGRLEQIHPGVARLPGAPTTAEQRIAAAVLATDGALASHRSAARLWGLPRPASDPVDLILVRSRRGSELEGVVIHRPRDRHRLIPSRRMGIRCTNLLRTLVDLGAVDPAGVSDAVGHTVSSRLVSLPALRAAAEQHGAKGRAGMTAFRQAVAEYSIDQKPADSVLEPALRALFRRYRLGRLEFHPVIEGWEVDFRVVGTLVLIECDGWTSHGLERDQFERDRRRDADLTAAGWVVLRFSYRAIVGSPERTASRIRENLARWSTTPSPIP